MLKTAIKITSQKKNNQNKVQSIHVNVGAKEDQMTSFQD